jgi:transportin-3
LEDYIQLQLQLLEMVPDVFFQSTAFPLAFKASMAALTLIHSDLVFAALDLFRDILTHDSLLPSSTHPAKFAAYATIIKIVVEKEGFEFVGYLLSGLVGDFPEDSTSSVVSIFRSIAVLFSSQLLTWLPRVLQQLPTSAAPNEAKEQFMIDVTK